MSLIYKKKNNLKVKKLDDGSIKVNSIYIINDVCKDIWNKIDGIRSVHDISIDMSYKYNISASDIKEDIKNLLNNFKNHGLIDEVW